MDAVLMGQRGPATAMVVDPWTPYVDLRRGALRDLARQRDLRYLTRPGLFGALPQDGHQVGGGLSVLGTDAMKPLSTALRVATRTG